MPQLSSPADDTAEADSSLNTETTNQYIWVSHKIQSDYVNFFLFAVRAVFASNFFVLTVSFYTGKYL